MFKLFVLFSIFLSAYANFECYPRSCNGSKHTLCKYSLYEFGSNCNSVKFNNLSQHLRKEIVYFHNVIAALSKIEDQKDFNENSVVEVPRYQWSNDLELMAQRWANQCQPGYDKCRDIGHLTVTQKYENLRSKNISQFFMYELIQNWSEIKLIDYKATIFDGMQTPLTVNNHPIIWGKISTYIGCGLIRFSTGEWYNTYLVCNYHPGSE